MPTNKLSKYLSDKVGLGESKSEDTAKVVKELLTKLTRFRRENDVYRLYTDEAVVNEFVKTLK